jgi:hypothetical protein
MFDTLPDDVQVAFVATNLGFAILGMCATAYCLGYHVVLWVRARAETRDGEPVDAPPGSSRSAVDAMLGTSRSDSSDFIMGQIVEGDSLDGNIVTGQVITI